MGTVRRVLPWFCVLACTGAAEAPHDFATTTTDTGSESSATSEGSSGSSSSSGGAEQTPFEWPDDALADSVDPMIGTGGIGFTVGTTNPGASLPFGMVKPGPDTGFDGAQLGFLNCTGYHFDQTHIWGFSHSRINGMGVPDYGAVLVMPTLDVDAEATTIGGSRSAFSHDSEASTAGYYAVTLADVDVRAELTATTRVGLHRYTWREPGTTPSVVFDLGYNPAGARSPDSRVVIDPSERVVSGMTTVFGSYSARFGGVPTYFAARVSAPFSSHGVWDDADVLAPGGTEAAGGEIGAWIEVSPQAARDGVTVAVALSYVSVEQARLNLDAELPDSDFDATRDAAAAAWETDLARIRVLGGTASQRRMFYTALYHAFLAPTTFSDVDGSYRGFDDRVHADSDRAYYSDFSLWDTYRSLHPLLNLVQRERHGDMLQSLVRMAEQGGDLPKWALGTGYTGGMVGTSADIVLADAALAEVPGFDQATAYAAAKRHATAAADNAGRAGIDGYVERGWVASDDVGSSVSRTLEFAVADHGLARWAEARGEIADRDVFSARARNFENVWSAEHGYFIGRRADGSFEGQGFTSDTWMPYYAEGTAGHYLWMVPHDPAALAELLGGPQAARTRLEDYMTASKAYLNGSSYTPLQPVPYYWHANEPSLHATYLFAAWGDPAATQRWVAWATAHHYGDGPDGLPGNDDAGTMSAWYVWSAIGLAPLPTTGRFTITAPMFERIRVHLGDSDNPARELEVIAEGAGPGMIYVASAEWNGEPLVGPDITWSQLRDGGTLRLQLSDQP